MRTTSTHVRATVRSASTAAREEDEPWHQPGSFQFNEPDCHSHIEVIALPHTLARIPTTERSRFLATLLGLGALAITGVGCEPVPESILDWPTQDRRFIKDVVDDSAAVVLLLLDPADCFSCNNILADWALAKARESSRVVIVFTREPTQRESPHLVFRRLQPDAILGNPGGVWHLETPAEYVVREGRTVHHAVLPERQIEPSSLLRLARGGDLSSLDTIPAVRFAEWESERSR